MKRIILTIILLFLSVPSLYADPVDLDNLTTEQQELLDEHIYGGLPGTQNIYIRNGYILSYNPNTKTPDWVAYHIVPDYLNTPERDGIFASFRKDPDIENEPSDNDYNGLYASRGYVRGHLAPFNVMGGDRDGDGKYAVLDSPDSDPDDELTVKQGNYMTNIAPQQQDGFNNSPGLWRKLEEWIQDELVGNQGKEVWVPSTVIITVSKAAA